jgi:type I restriction enzyme S subunit
MTRQYKDSGIEWIGQIPMDWKMQPLAIYFAENSKSNSDLGSVNALQFKYGEIIQKPNNGKELTDKDRELLEKYTVVSPDDIVVNGLNLNYDLKSLRIAKVREDGIITSAYIVLRPRNGANASFYNYYLKALDFQKIFHGMGVGIRLTLSYNELRSMLLAVPSLEEQQRIADYLDKKCTEIDGLIELQEQMIAQLTDYKQSVITEAVTKGLNNKNKLVPSGIDWIEEIPEGWMVCRIKDLVNLQSGTNLTTMEISDNGTYPVYGGNGLRGYYEEYSNDGEYILIGRQGALCGNINYASGKFWATEHAVVCYPKREFAKKWLGELLRTMNLGQYSLSAAQPGLSVERIKNLKMPLPSIFEQQIIASYLDSKCSEIDNLIAVKQQKIEMLKEYKKSLIFECVTGKKEIN